MKCSLKYNANDGGYFYNNFRVRLDERGLSWLGFFERLNVYRNSF